MRRGFYAALAALVLGACNAPVVFGDEPPKGSGGADAGGMDVSPRCISNGGCTPPLLCDTASGACVVCLSTSDCTPAAPRCDPVGHVCGPCQEAADCPPGNACDATGHCIDTCLSGLPCPGETPICDPRGVCVRCTRNSDCTAPGAPTCDRTNGQCTACTSNAQCDHDRPRCDIATGGCGRCTSNADCPADHPSCTVEGACDD
jgi:hypothetical protein